MSGNTLAKKVAMILSLIVLGIVLVGCGASTGKSQSQSSSSNKTSSNTASTQDSDTAQTHHLTPISKGTPIVTANNQLTKQLMAQKDVLGTQISDQKGIIYGKITFKSGVSKTYAHDLANEFLNQLKVNYPKRQIIAQVIVDGKTTDSISYKP